MSARLNFSNVQCVRRGRTLFEGLSFALQGGDALILTGPNGAGKSSLLRVAAGLLPVAAGSVQHEGDRALLAEATALDGAREVADVLHFWARLDSRPAPAARVAAALDALDLANLADVPVRLLSTGQRRRVGLARVAASGAPIWLLDEPATGLDAAAVTRLEGLIGRHRARGGIALITTHQPLAVVDALEIRL
ncbi:heme ABC exporter ATP-binding protein CcmA [Sphingomonas sp. TX0543]|uniref:heme ABC exporter ATP-binding protein CcmA n=1 Tax=unclassified Sphingomonas TaxID=196159 RepID=UPI0010F870EF|nr:heme ABC exporter ATP-binding protein CcmA [Sphingomonas sp. 3P27F8]